MGDDENEQPPSPNTVNGKLKDVSHLKASSAFKAPISYPVGSGKDSYSDSEDEDAAFTISTRPSHPEQTPWQAVVPALREEEPEDDEIPKSDSPASIKLSDEISSLEVRHLLGFVTCFFVGVEASAIFYCVINSATHLTIMQINEPRMVTKFVAPEDKLLKPLPDKPIECTKLPDGPEPVVVEIEYPARDALQPLDNPNDAIESMVAGLDSSNWVDACKALLTLRQLAVHHPTECTAILPAAVPLVIKSVRSLRSSLCKTAVMATTDLVLSFGDDMLPLCDVGGPSAPIKSLLSQLLLKCASNDKKFVIEEAIRALNTLASGTTPAKFLPMLAPYIDHKNLKVRGKAGIVLAATVTRMTPMEAAEYGLPSLLKFSGKLITDNTPDARESAKQMAVFLRKAFADSHVQSKFPELTPPEPESTEQVLEEGEEPKPVPGPWQRFLKLHLNPSASVAVLRVAAE